MEKWANSLTSDAIQCWTCPLFDNLFDIVSKTAAVAYQRLIIFCIIIFVALFGVYIINAVWKNLKSDNPDPIFNKHLQPILVKSLFALTLLTMGLAIPQMISKITFEPAAVMTLKYSEKISEMADIKAATYTPVTLTGEHFFNPELRDTLLKLIETSVTNFQLYINFGIAIIDEAFSIDKFFGYGGLIKHILICFIGLILTYNFVRLFIKYSFCFMDIIVAMAMFAFFFPLSLILYIFKGAPDLPGWMKNLGGNLGSGQVKKIINAIVSVASAILTYTVIMLIIKGYLDTNGFDIQSLQNSTPELFDFDLENSTAMQITLSGVLVLVYVVRYLADQIPEITKKILSIFNISQESEMSDKAGEDVLQLTKIVKDNASSLVKTIATSGKSAPGTSGTP